MSYGGQQNRTEWYDRAPLPVSAEYVAQGVAPHGDTQRWAYTVPASRKCIAEVVLASTIRDAIAGANGWQLAYVRRNASNTMVIAQSFASVVGATFAENIGASITLYAAEVMTGRTQDNSTGGSFIYVVSFKGTEFDA